LSCTVRRISDPHPFHADPDPGFEKFADPDPDPGCEKICGSGTRSSFLQKISVYLRKKAKKELRIRIKNADPDQDPGASKCGSNADPDPKL